MNDLLITFFLVVAVVAGLMAFAHSQKVERSHLYEICDARGGVGFRAKTGNVKGVDTFGPVLCIKKDAIIEIGR